MILVIFKKYVSNVDDTSSQCLLINSDRDNIDRLFVKRFFLNRGSVLGWWDWFNENSFYYERASS